MQTAVRAIYRFERTVNLVSHIRYLPFDDVAEPLEVYPVVGLANNAALMLLHLILPVPAWHNKVSKICLEHKIAGFTPVIVDAGASRPSAC